MYVQAIVQCKSSVLLRFSAYSRNNLIQKNCGKVFCLARIYIIEYNIEYNGEFTD